MIFSRSGKKRWIKVSWKKPGVPRHGYPEYDAKQVAAFSIGERDARLLQVRAHMFGTTLRNAGSCPECKQRIEWEVPVADLQLQPIGQHTSPENIMIDYEGHELHLRLPNSEDILACRHRTVKRAR